MDRPPLRDHRPDDATAGPHGTGNLDPSSFIPLYQQLKDILKTGIAAGKWKVDEAIPSENELAAHYRVAVGTVKKALAELSREGAVVRLQGRGTFVARPDFGRSFFRFFRFDLDPALGSRIVPGSRVLASRITRPAPEVRKALRLGRGGQVLHITRLRTWEDVPLMYEDIFLPADRFKGLEQVDISQRLLYPIYDTRFATPVIWAEEFLEPRLATANLAGHLGLREGDPVIYVERTAYTYEDLPVEFRCSFGRGDRFRYHIELR